MAKSLFSPSWYRVAELKPRLRNHIQVHRHSYRGQPWFVLQDNSSARYFRFSAPVYDIIGLLDGHHSVQQIWDSVLERRGDDVPRQDEIIQLLGQLHAADALQCDIAPDSEEVFERYRQKRLNAWKQRLLNPMSLKFPLLDPDEFLERWVSAVHPLFSWIGVAIWLTVVGFGAVTAGLHWEALTDNVVSRALSPYNLLLLALAYPCIKVVHELGHAFATKVWGGAVHEMGITLLVLMPVPYVDASSASAFLDKRHRMAVAGAGIAVELFLAALALFVWISVEPGMVREFAFNIMLIGGVSTVIFNGNPLLRFDGYYVFSDLIEIPNLATRSKKYLSYLVLRYLFGVSAARSPVTAPGEAGWFFVYGLASFAYRIFITFTIILLIAGKFFMLGMLLASWMVLIQIVWPLIKQIRFLLTGAEIRRHRARSVATVTLLVSALLSAVVFVPMPLSTQAQGVIWPAEQSRVLAATDATLTKIVAVPGKPVKTGDVLFETEDPFLSAKVKVLESELDVLLTRHQALLLDNRVEADILSEEISAKQADLDQNLQRQSQLLIKSPAEGTFVVAAPEDLPGRFVKQGELLGYVTDASAITARVVVTQSDILRVRSQTTDVQIKFADRIDRTLPAVVIREVPAANYLLPSEVLGAAGGGTIPVDATDPRGTKALEKIFQLDVSVMAPLEKLLIGERLFVRFDHGSEPLIKRWQQSVSRLLLRHFDV